MNLEQTRMWLEDKEIKVVAERSGVPYYSLQRFAKGVQKELKGSDWMLLQSYIADSCKNLTGCKNDGN